MHGLAGEGVTGSNADAATCMTRKEAEALKRMWYRPTLDGSYEPAQAAAGRSGAELGPRQLWWGSTRNANLTGQITNASTPVRNRWQGLTCASYAQAFTEGLKQHLLADYATDKANLGKLRSLGRKMILWSSLAEDVIPPARSVNCYERVKAAAGGEAEVQKFLRMVNMPGMAHSSQGRASTVGGNNNTVPMPALPGNGNQTPTPEQDTMFSALVDWVERGKAPGDTVITSRDKSTSYPVCVYPKKITWIGTGSAKAAASYSCQ